MADSRLKAYLIRFIESEGRDFLSVTAQEQDHHLFCALRTGSHAAEALVGTTKRYAASLSLSRKNTVLDRLKKVLASPDESFSERILRLIRESGMSEAECYKRAHIDRKHFSKIRSDLNHRPKKQTVLAFALALELDENGAEQLLASAGYALSFSDRFDLAIRYFIRDGIYDIMLVNEMLLELDLPLLGA